MKTIQVIILWQNSLKTPLGVILASQNSAKSKLRTWTDVESSLCTYKAANSILTEGKHHGSTKVATSYHRCLLCWFIVLNKTGSFRSNITWSKCSSLVTTCHDHCSTSSQWDNWYQPVSRSHPHRLLFEERVHKICNKTALISFEKSPTGHLWSDCLPQ